MLFRDQWLESSLPGFHAVDVPLLAVEHLARGHKLGSVLSSIELDELTGADAFVKVLPHLLERRCAHGTPQGIAQ